MRVTDPHRFGRVAVLYGGDSPERSVSLESGAAVCAALQSKGVDALLFDPAEDSVFTLPERGVTRCFNALHGGHGEDGTIAGALAVMRLPCTGSGVAASALAMDKIRSKQVLMQSGIAVPATLEVAADDGVPADLPLPVFVKPACGGSSIAARPVSRSEDLAQAIAAATAGGDRALIEPLQPGPEYTLAVLQGKVLPPIRIEVTSEFYDYDAKYVSDSTRFVCPALAADAPLAQRLASMALASFSALGCAGWGRVDFIMDAAGEPLVLEVNTVPGMTSHSLVPCAAAAAGIDFATLCWRILETSVAETEVAHGR